MPIDEKYIINRQGKDFVLYEGILDEAHRQGLKRITTTLIQVPHQDNGNVAIVAAEVEIEKGVFSGIGDASPANVNRMILPHIIRMAETRAKARALRDAVNISEVAFEELEDGATSETHQRDDKRNESSPQNRGANARSEPASSKPSPGRIRQARALCISHGQPVPKNLDSMSASEITSLIEQLQGGGNNGITAEQLEARLAEVARDAGAEPTFVLGKCMQAASITDTDYTDLNAEQRVRLVAQLNRYHQQHAAG